MQEPKGEAESTEMVTHPYSLICQDKGNTLISAFLQQKHVPQTKPFGNNVDIFEIYCYINLQGNTKVMTMNTATADIKDFLASGELIPAEVNATLKREVGRSFRRPSGATMNDQGHINLYAIEPEASPAAETTEAQKFRLGVLFALVTWVPIGVAALVS